MHYLYHYHYHYPIYPIYPINLSDIPTLKLFFSGDSNTLTFLKFLRRAVTAAVTAPSSSISNTNTDNNSNTPSIHTTNSNSNSNINDANKLKRE